METTVACSAHQSLLSHLQVEVWGEGKKKGWQMCVHRGEGGRWRGRYKRTSPWHTEEEEDLDTKRRNAVFALFSTSITRERRRARAGLRGAKSGPSTLTLKPLSKTLTTNCTLTTLYVGLYVCSRFQQERLQRCLSDTWNGPQPSGGEAPRETVARSTSGERETIEEVETLSHFHVKFWMISPLQMNGRGKHICSRLISVLNDWLLRVCLKDSVKYTVQVFGEIQPNSSNIYCQISVLYRNISSVGYKIHFYLDTGLLQWFSMWAVVWLTGCRSTWRDFQVNVEQASTVQIICSSFSFFSEKYLLLSILLSRSNNFLFLNVGTFWSVSK